MKTNLDTVWNFRLNGKEEKEWEKIKIFLVSQIEASTRIHLYKKEEKNSLCSRPVDWL